MRVYIVQKCFYNSVTETLLSSEPIMVTANYEEAKKFVDDYFSYVPIKNYDFEEINKSSDEYDGYSLGDFCGSCECVYERIKKMNIAVFSYTVLTDNFEQ